jgi:hypothetical protein
MRTRGKMVVGVAVAWLVSGGMFLSNEAQAVAGGRATAPSEVAFARLAALAGSWEGVQQGVAVILTYTLTADGTALMEEMRPAGSAPMITMFSVDGDRLLATHYCSAGNQPQMATGPIASASSPSLEFSLLRVTGLKTRGDWHNTGLALILEDADHLTQRWSYEDHGKTGINVFHYARKR